MGIAIKIKEFPFVMYSKYTPTAIYRACIFSTNEIKIKLYRKVKEAQLIGHVNKVSFQISKKSHLCLNFMGNCTPNTIEHVFVLSENHQSFCLINVSILKQIV